MNKNLLYFFSNANIKFLLKTDEDKRVIESIQRLLKLKDGEDPMKVYQVKFKPDMSNNDEIIVCK
jgi:hypothetical protein